jgi:hypothetical protein
MNRCPNCGSYNIINLNSNNYLCNICLTGFPIIEETKPITGNWRYGNGYVCCGTMRIFRIDIDTNPGEEYINELMDWVCQTLNK